MSGQGGPPGSTDHEEAKQRHNKASFVTCDPPVVVANDELDCRCKSDLKVQTHKRKREREQYERGKRKQFLDKVSHGAPS